MSDEGIIFGLLGLVALILLFVVVYGVFQAAVTAECLAAGYPNAAITWNFNAYCMNLEGTVTVAVDRLGGK